VKLQQSNYLKAHKVDTRGWFVGCHFCTFATWSISEAFTKRTLYRTVLQRSNFMTTITASEARAGLYRLIDQTAETHKPVLISGKRANAVLVSEEDWSAIQETLYLLAIPGMRESIKEAMAEPVAKSKRTLKW
jgi:antitoxin YefM